MKLTGPACTEALNEAEEAERRERTEDNAGGVRVERRVRGTLSHECLMLESNECGKPNEDYQPKDGDLRVTQIEPGATRLTGSQMPLVSIKERLFINGHVGPFENA